MDEALALLREHGDDAKPLAGGQSLIPAMNFRLAQPAVLVDLGPVTELAGVRPLKDGGVAIGAMTRQRAVERDAAVAERAPLVHEAMPWIAHPQIRNRGTFGGSLAHADPAAELPAVVLALGARCTVQGAAGRRTIDADAFFTGLFATALAPGELLVEVTVPPLPHGTGWAFEEIARRHGDFALAGVAAVVTVRDGACMAARIALFSVGDGPVLARSAGDVLVGQAPSDELLVEAAEAAATADCDPPADIHASAAYRRQLVRTLTRRALTRAVARATGGPA